MKENIKDKMEGLRGKENSLKCTKIERMISAAERRASKTKRMFSISDRRVSKSGRRT